MARVGAARQARAGPPACGVSRRTRRGSARSKLPAVKAARNFGLLALIALLIVLLPGGGPTLNVLLTVLTVAFFASIAFFGYRLYREHRFTLDALDQTARTVLYCSVAAAFLVFTATNRLFDLGGVGVLVWLALLAA